MALTAAGYVTRINNEMVLLANPAASQPEIIKDALTDLMTYIRDMCRLNATMAVDGTTDEYDIPATIDIVEKVYDDDSDPIVFSVDRLLRKITLQNSESASGSVNYTVYGTPLDVRTNYETIIASLPESYSGALWAYIVAGCYEQAMHEMSDSKLNRAKLKAHELLLYLNSNAGMRDRTITMVDFTGARVGDTNAADGIDYEINNLGDTETFDPTS